jgi:single-strand DNA-binding protein
MNKVILIGNVGKDPIIKEKFASFTIATTEKYKDKDGKKQEKTEWHSCIVFGNTIELVSKYITKGMKLMVEGQIKYSEKDNRYYTNIYVSNIEFISKSNSESNEK